MSVEDGETRTYGGWFRPTSVGFGRLGTIPTYGGLAGIMVGFVLFQAGQRIIGIGFILLTLIFVALTVITDREGRTPLMNLRMWIEWKIVVLKKGNKIFSSLLFRNKKTVVQLPGLLSKMVLEEYQDGIGHSFGVIFWDTGTSAIVFRCSPEGQALVDPEQTDGWVSGFANFLTTLCVDPAFHAAQVVVDASPDSGESVALEVSSTLDPHSPLLARQVMNEITDSYANTAAPQVHAYVAVSFKNSDLSGSSEKDEIAADIAYRIPNLLENLAVSGAGSVAPMTCNDIREFLRSSYDPASAQTFAQARMRGETISLTNEDVAPVAQIARWDSYHHDSGISVSWVMSTPPKGVVRDSVLSRLLSPARGVWRKRVSLFYSPIDTGQAAVITELGANQARSKYLNSPNAHANLDKMRAEKLAEEEARGAGLTDFAMIITATVRDKKQEKALNATMQSISSSAHIRIRKAYGAQAGAFSASLPLGVVLPDFIMTPKILQEVI